MVSAQGAPALRFQVDQRGDLVVFGNTLGYDCRAVTPKPTVGDVDAANCGTGTNDLDIDVLWRSEEPSAGRATASPAITPDMARSTAMLNLPAGAVPTYARIYWSAQGPKGQISPGASIIVERPGVFTQTVVADTTGMVDDANATGTHYQQSADITSLVQTYGAGTYRVSGVVTTNPVNVSDQLLYAAWSTVVFYAQKTAPPRLLTLFDGFDEVAGNHALTTKLDRFLVPSNSGFDAKLAIIGYEGNPDSTGDRIIINNNLAQPLSDALNDGTNFFNGTRSVLGQAMSVAGDLPQTNGQAGSLSGLDMDIVDITGRLKAGDKSLDFMASTTNDSYFLGVLAGAIATLKPIFSESEITYHDLSNPGGSVRPGDKLQFTVNTPNTGSDPSVDTYVTVQLPPGLTYVPGSIRVNNGPNAGDKSDALSDDQAEYDPVTRTIKVRVGTGATPTKGGSVTTTETAPSIQFQATVDPSANNTDVKVGAMITASGMAGSMQGIPPATWNAGSVLTPLDGPNKGTPVFYPNHPLVIPVRECQTNLDCPLMKPRCDVAAARCTNACQVDADCSGTGIGQVCTAAKVCGCNKDSDCLSGSCDTATRQCRIPNVDLSVTVRTTPNPPQPKQPVTHVITVTNNGPDTAPPGVTVVYNVPPGGTITQIEPGPDWQCSQMSRTITCTHSGTIPPGTAAPQIRITVTPDPTRATVDISTTVKSPGSSDPSPDNNSVTRSDAIGGAAAPEDQIAGGGFSCNIGGQAATHAQGAALLALFAVLGLGLGRRRIRAAR